MRHTLLLLFLVACTDLPVDEWSAAEDDADSNAPPTHPLEDCPGNAPGGPVADLPGGPGKRCIPPERDCTEEPDHESCYACCDWNADKVWGERCRRMRNEKKRNKCWEDLENTQRPKCQSECPRLSLTPEEAPL